MGDVAQGTSRVNDDDDQIPLQFFDYFPSTSSSSVQSSEQHPPPSGSSPPLPPTFAELNLNSLTTSSGTYVCPVCGQEKQHISVLKKHYATHSGEKPYCCPLCPFRSSQNSSLYRHAMVKHRVYLTRPGRDGKVPQLSGVEP